jgi:hypothetical protein
MDSRVLPGMFAGLPRYCAAAAAAAAAAATNTEPNIYSLCALNNKIVRVALVMACMTVVSVRSQRFSVLKQ